MDAITQFLASLFNAFRLKNPTVAAVVLLVLSTVTYTAMKGDVLGLFHLDGLLKWVVETLSLTLTVLVGGGSAIEGKK